MGGKYSLSSNVTLEATYNPDFSQIEADAGQIDVNTTFALFYPERRPFFQEGSDIFRTLFNSFYTRTINDPEFAAKLTARGDRTSLGYMIALDENSPITLPFEEFSDFVSVRKSTANVLRFRQALGSSAHAGIIATHRSFEQGGSGSVIATDGRIRFSPTLSLDYQLIATHTSEAEQLQYTGQLQNPDRYDYLETQYVNDDSLTAAFDGESYWGYGGLSVLRWHTSTWNAAVNYWQVDQTYRADNGFDPKVNRRDLNLSTGYRYRPEGGLFVRINPWIETGAVWNYDGERKERYVRLNLQSQLSVSQLRFFTQFLKRDDFIKSLYIKQDTDGNFVNDPRHFDGQWSLYQDASMHLGDPLAFGADFTCGHRLARRQGEKATIISAGGWTEIKWHERVRMSQWINYTKANALDDKEEFFSTYIYHTRVDYQVSDPLTFRLVAEYNEGNDSWAFDPLVTYRINPFSVLYIGSASYYAGGFPSHFRQELDVATNNWETTDVWGSSNELVSRQFFMKLQYLFQM